jgi:hypothetical protein
MVERGLAEVRYLLPSEVERCAPDVLIWHRVALRSVQHVDRVLTAAAHVGARTVYDIDDNLLDMAGHPEQAAYSGLTGAVRLSLQSAEEVWCSTPALEALVRSEARGSVVVMPNALDPVLWGTAATRPAPPPGTDEVLRVLYMGTRTHDADFALVCEAFHRLHREHPGKTELSIIGVRTSESEYPWLRSLRLEPQLMSGSYPAFVHSFRGLTGFHLGIAPLLSSRFNDCKSPIKVLDYAAIGLPTLASEVPAYTHTLVSGVNCLHVKNIVDAWEGSLQEIVERRTPLDEIADHALVLVQPDVFELAVERRWLRLTRLVSGNARVVR